MKGKQMIKHVGRHNEKRCVVVFREVPGEEHMALVVYPDTLPTHFHDDLMNCLQSDAGQNANNLADALHRTTGTDGRVLLSAIHEQRWMKKVRTQDVIMIPQPNNPGVQLSEINTIIAGLETGSEAAAKMADLDANAGLADPDKRAAGQEASAAIMSGSDGALSDADIARNLVAQAEQMKAQIATLEAESNRLMTEASELDSSVAPKKRGRPAKSKAVVM
jgi:hypothetical protein